MRDANSLARRTAAGASWSLAHRLVVRLVGFAVTLVLVRLLTPSDFGLVGMVAVFTGFGKLFSEFGLGTALVQRPELAEVHRSSVFWINLGAGLILSLAFLGFAHPIAAFFGEPILVPLVWALAPAFVLRAAGVVPRALLTRQLDFKALFIADSLAVVAGGALAITLAVQGVGVWSLVAQALAGAVLTSCGVLVLARWRPRSMFDWPAVRSLASFGVSVLGVQAMGYWMRRLDNLLVGKVFGASALGIYGQAYNVLSYPVEHVKGALIQVLFPALSRLQDAGRMRRAYRRAVGATALVVYPSVFVLLLTAEDLVATVFGPAWAEMVPLLRVFGLLALWQSVTFSGVLFLSTGRPDLQLRVNLVTNVLIIAGMVIGLQFGVLGVAVGYAIGSTLAMVPRQYFAGQLAGMSVLDTFAGVGWPLAASIVAALAAWGAGVALGAVMSITANIAVWHLIVHTLTLSGTYLLLVVVLKPPAYRDLLSLLRRLPRQGEAS
ncbi:MAG: lipopolysaccharide biosynthesis protein [Bacteroidota bacterium]